MQFAKPLRAGVAGGEISCSVRIWQQPRVRVGGRYRLGAGAIYVTSLREIAPTDITDALAKRSGFANVDALLATARHGRGDRVFLVEFGYEEDEAT